MSAFEIGVLVKLSDNDDLFGPLAKMGMNHGDTSAGPARASSA
jgi:hypothetical protein